MDKKIASSSLDWDSPSYKTGTVKRRPISGISDVSSGSENCDKHKSDIAKKHGAVISFKQCGGETTNDKVKYSGMFVETSQSRVKHFSSISKNLKLPNLNSTPDIAKSRKYKLTCDDVQKHETLLPNNTKKSIEIWRKDCEIKLRKHPSPKLTKIDFENSRLRRNKSFEPSEHSNSLTTLKKETKHRMQNVVEFQSHIPHMVN